jgi:cytochrome P450
MARTMLEDDAARPSAQSQLDIIKDVAGVIYVSGADTTGSALLSFFLAMLVYPEVQAKAQAEVDRVVGPGRLPDFSDQKDMPYVTVRPPLGGSHQWATWWIHPMEVGVATKNSGDHHQN